MADVLEYVYNDRDNTIDLLLKADNTAGVLVATDLSSVTRMIVQDINGTWSVDEDDSPTAFDRDTGVTGKVIISLGSQSIAAGKYWCQLIVYDPSNTNGIIWGNDEFIIVVA